MSGCRMRRRRRRRIDPQKLALQKQQRPIIRQFAL